ncbi:hypothetical protein ACBQ28_23050 [Pseudomonas lundensis]|uniref:hypothetical protein n=1 Tax=Pseudomonas lundensis TaxID=86185 RepID=UPI00352589F5
MNIPAPTKDEIIRASESIKQSTAKIEKAARALAAQGRHEEAQAIEKAVKGLKESLARIRVCEDGKIVKVH